MKLSFDYSLHYGRFLGNLDEHLDGGGDVPPPADYQDFFAGSIEDIGDHAKDAGDFQLLRPWLEFLIARVGQPLDDLRSRWVHTFCDLVHPGSGSLSGYLTHEDWKGIFEFARQQLFGPLPPLTEADKKRIRAETTMVEESLEDFRKRMAKEGRLDPPESE